MGGDDRNIFAERLSNYLRVEEIGVLNVQAEKLKSMGRGVRKMRRWRSAIAARASSGPKFNSPMACLSANSDSEMELISRTARSSLKAA